jgi:hypothetical protein
MNLYDVVDDNLKKLIRLQRKRSHISNDIKRFNKLEFTKKVVDLFKGKINNDDFCKLIDKCLYEYKYGHYIYNVDYDFDVVKMFMKREDYDDDYVENIDDRIIKINKGEEL